MPDSWDFNKKPERPTPPIMTWSLALLCVVVTGAHWASGTDRSSPWYALGHLGWLPPEDIWAGHIWPLLTSVFQHAGIMHILFNLWVFVRLGSVMEETLNPLYYALFLISSAFIGSGAELAYSGETGVGLSGVVFAMCGLMWAGRSTIAAWRPVMTREMLNQVLIWGVFCVIATWTNTMRVANAAHFGGLLYGFAVGFLFYSARRRPLWAGVLVALVAITVLSVTWMPWNVRWLIWKADTAHKHGRYREEIAWLRRSISDDRQALIAWARIAGVWGEIGKQARTTGDQVGMKAAAEQQRSALTQMIAVGRRLQLKPVEIERPSPFTPPPVPPSSRQNHNGA